ncbi:MAG: tRNA glutamyl-Q(34) synthetase GluQRS [Sumerlaeia bacterium]
MNQSSPPNQSTYRGRFAPTPSGALHVGNLRTALAAYCHAKKLGGAFLLRFDDLDEPRVKADKLDEHQSDLAFFGLTPDEPPTFQSQRKQLYAKAFEQLRETSAIYACFCTRREIQEANQQHNLHPENNPDINAYPGTCRSIPPKEAEARLQRNQHHCWRFALKQPAAALNDLVMGPQTVDLQQNGGDFVVVRADGQFSYQLACAVDDSSPGITMVLRGVDLLISAARQQTLMTTLGLTPPQYGHLPLLTTPSGRKLSKTDGDDDLRAYTAKGYSQPALLSALAYTLGLAEQGEVVSLQDCVERFPKELSLLPRLKPFPLD